MLTKKARFCSKLNLPKTVHKQAEAIVVKATNIRDVNGRSPTSIAAACIYLAAELCGQARSYDDISKICGAAITTIKQIIKEVHPHVKDLGVPIKDSKLFNPITNSKS